MIKYLLCYGNFPNQNHIQTALSIIPDNMLILHIYIHHASVPYTLPTFYIHKVTMALKHVLSAFFWTIYSFTANKSVPS